METAAPQFTGGPKLLEQIRDSPMVGSGESDGLKSSAQAEAASPTRPAKRTNPVFSIADEFMIAPSFQVVYTQAMQRKATISFFSRGELLGKALALADTRIQ